MKVVNNVIICIIMGGLLGVYPHCKVIANFHFRRLLYRFFSLSIPTKEIFDKWLNSNKDLIIYIFRDYVLYMIEGIPPLHNMLCQTYYWDTVVESTREGMDYVRNWFNHNVNFKTTHLPDVNFTAFDITSKMQDVSEKMYIDSKIENNMFDDFFTCGQSVFESSGNIIEPFKKKNLKDCPRPISQSFLDKVYKKMVAIDDLYLIPQNIKKMICSNLQKAVLNSYGKLLLQ